MTTDTSKAPDAGVNTNTLSPVPPEQDPTRFLGMSTKDGETVTDKPTPAAAKDTNGKTAAKPVAKAAKGDEKTDDEADEKGEEGEKAKPARPAQKRIDQAVARQRAAERRADLSEASNAALARRIEALERGGGTTVDKGTKSATSEGKAPQPSDYEYGELDARFIRDLARHEAKQEIAADRAKESSEQQQSKQTEASRERAAKVETWATEGSEKHDDFDEVVIQGAKDGLWPLSETLGQLLMESDVGHDIAYALASSPKEAMRIAKLSAARQAAWFGTEEARLTAEAESSGNTQDESTTKLKVTQAPTPSAHKAKGSGSSTPVSADTQDFAAFERLAQKPN